ncbi:uncharacterized protein LOC135811577 [Sycon ciliatum]|uniref:uncharacterized protein LOC135811577 n=1 Tax=Sycon ciliatum TaxID=27933 RepID=UPI0031F66B04
MNGRYVQPLLDRTSNFIYSFDSDVARLPALDMSGSTSNIFLSDLPNPAQVHQSLTPLIDQNVAPRNQQCQIEQAFTSSACKPQLPYTPCQSVADGSLATSAVRTQVDNVPRRAALQRQHAEGPRPSVAQLRARLRSQLPALDISAMGNTTVANMPLDMSAMGSTTVANISLDMSALGTTAQGSASLDMSALVNTAPGSASLDMSALGNIAVANTNNDVACSSIFKNCESPINISRPIELDMNVNFLNQSKGSSPPLQSCYGDLQTPPVPASSLGSSHLSLSSTDQVSPVSQFGLFGSSDLANVMQQAVILDNEQKEKKTQARLVKRRNRNKLAASRCREKTKKKAAEDWQKMQEQEETIEQLRRIVASQKIVIDHYPRCAACGVPPSQCAVNLSQSLDSAASTENTCTVKQELDLAGSLSDLS